MADLISKFQKKNVLRFRHKNQLSGPFGDHPITGHIDFLQLRSGFLPILDYKPEARKEKHAVMQLTIYALALSRRTSLPVKAFKCARFDERDYFEFFPLPAIYPRP